MLILEQERISLLRILLY